MLKPKPAKAHSAASVAPKNKRGRKAHITLEVVKRVAERVGVGLTLQLALAAERNPHVNLDSWHKALSRHAEFVHPLESAKADFLQKALARLAEAQDLANLRWLLERRHSDLFARSSDTTINVSQSVTTGTGMLSDAELESIARGSRKGIA